MVLGFRGFGVMVLWAWGLGSQGYRVLGFRVSGV